MDNRTMIIIGVLVGTFIVAVIVAVAMAIWFYSKNKRTRQLRSKFGPEYNRAVRADDGNTGHAWEHAQARFVDDPQAAVANADVLVQEVMGVRGYPVTDFEQRVADVSVDHPAVVQNYRIAHDIAARHEHEDVGIEKLREAMIHYRALFADLLNDGGLQPVRQVVPEERERIRRVG